ncbi:MAG: DUF2911 domain-containing protein [Planctomycetes bacterium]|nr:DUF2911 domain-containing protein [Planctomycetota bacterium]
MSRIRLAVLAVSLTALPAQKPPTIDAPAWQRARAVWFGQAATPTVVAEVCIGWERLPAEHPRLAAFATAPDGAPVPMGNAVWPVLETFTEVQIGGVEVPRGCHPFALQRRGEEHALVLFDAEVLRKAKTPVTSPPPKGAIATIPLRSKTAGDPSPLHCEVTTGDDGAFTWTLRAAGLAWSVGGVAKSANGGFPLAQPMERGCSRAVFTGGTATLDHGRPQWNDKLAQAMAGMKAGTHWRFGNDWWTTLQTDLPLTIGGKKLAPGHWHLVVERTKNGWNLACCAADEQFRNCLDAFAADRVTPALSVPFAIGKAKEPTAELRAEFALDGGKLALVVTFGDQRLVARVAG